MKLAILADPIDNQNAGIHVFTREMVAAMVRTNPGHEIFLIREKRDPGLKGAKQIPIWNTRLPIGFASLRLFFIVPWILHKKKVDVVIEPAHFGPFNLAKRIKRVTIIHDLTPILFPKLHRWHSQTLQRIFLKGILNKVHLIIANSDNTAKDICQVYPQNCRKVKRIYPGIGRQFKDVNNTGVLEKYNIKLPYFLFVGTIEPRKNLLVLLEAFRLFKQNDMLSVNLVIAGSKGWKSKSFFKTLNEHPYKAHIKVTGFVDTADLPAIYSHALALIYPSLYEGFGLPVLESMSCGTPVLTANNSSLPEAGGSAAQYFDAKNPEAMAKQMLEVSTNVTLRSKLSHEGLEHVKKFNWDNFAREMWASITGSE